MVNVAVYIGFWVAIAILGITTLFQTGATFSHITCELTGEVVRSSNMCPECFTTSDCQTEEIKDRMCNLQTNRCMVKTCNSIVDCQEEGSVCEHNRCVNELRLAEQRRARLANL